MLQLHTNIHGFKNANFKITKLRLYNWLEFQAFAVSCFGQWMMSLHVYINLIGDKTPTWFRAGCLVWNCILCVFGIQLNVLKFSVLAANCEGTSFWTWRTILSYSLLHTNRSVCSLYLCVHLSLSAHYHVISPFAAPDLSKLHSTPHLKTPYVVTSQ
jgi:hypothetical protein